MSAPTPGPEPTPAPTPNTTTTQAPSPAPAASPIPGPGFAASRYEALWTKSPFSVATSETVGEESPDYLLVGIANFDGISYASVLDAKPPQEHFLISTDHPTLGMTLKSINRSHDGLSTYAVVEKDGQMLTLKLQQPPAGAADTAGAPVINAPTPQIPMPGGTTPSVRPFTRFHRPPIHLPPQMPATAPQPPSSQGAPPQPVLTPPPQ